MARSVNSVVLDAALNYIADNGDRMDVCATEPTTYAEATSTKSLANFTLQLGTANPDYAIGIGDAGGDSRKLTISAQTGASIGTSGTADHLAITNGTDTLIYVTTVTSQAITAGGTVDTSAWDIEIGGPTA